MKLRARDLAKNQVDAVAGIWNSEIIFQRTRVDALGLNKRVDSGPAGIARSIEGNRNPRPTIGLKHRWGDALRAVIRVNGLLTLGVDLRGQRSVLIVGIDDNSVLGIPSPRHKVAAVWAPVERGMVTRVRWFNES